MQAASTDIWDKKYRLKAKNGRALDQTIDDTYKRIARALAEVEAPAKRGAWYEQFLWALRHGAIPAGRIISNAGAWEHKPATSTINCTVSGSIQDSMDDILEKVHEAGLTLKAGCGIGYEFSTLRPRGAYVSGAGAYTSGPLSFMDIYDAMCFTVSSAGGRRGARWAPSTSAIRMWSTSSAPSVRTAAAAVQPVAADHRGLHRGRQGRCRLAAGLSHLRPGGAGDGLDVHHDEQIIWREWPIHEGYLVNEAGLVACRSTRPSARGGCGI